VLVAHGLDPTLFPQSPRLAANLAGAEGLLCGDFDTSVNFLSFVIYIETQSTEFLFHLQHLELVLGHQWIQILAEPPDDFEPAVVMGEAPWHHCVPDVTLNVEPRGPTLDQFMLKFFAHLAASSGLQKARDAQIPTRGGDQHDHRVLRLLKLFQDLQCFLQR
jgi:hypothetical protein